MTTIAKKIDLDTFKKRFRDEYAHISHSLTDKEIKHFIARLNCSMDKALDLFSDYLLANDLADVQL